MNITGKINEEMPSEEIIHLDLNYFPQPWTESQWKQLNHYKLFTWRENTELIGFALFGINPADDVAHLFKILILPSRRGTNHMTDFWNSIVQQLKNLELSSVYLEVECENQRAIGFYKKNGFATLRKNKAFYSSGKDAWVMSLTL